jgi:hypothetical protein
MNVWDSTIHSSEQALELPQGSYAADFGFLVEQSVNPDHVLEAAQAIKNAECDVKAATQAKVMFLAQDKGLAFTDWASRIVLI